MQLFAMSSIGDEVWDFDRPRALDAFGQAHMLFSIQFNSILLLLTRFLGLFPSLIGRESIHMQCWPVGPCFILADLQVHAVRDPETSA